MNYKIEADGYNEINVNEELVKGDILFPVEAFEYAYYKVKSVEDGKVEMKPMKVSFSLDTDNEEIKGVEYKVMWDGNTLTDFKSETKLSKNQMVSLSNFGLGKVIGVSKGFDENFVEVELQPFKDFYPVYHTKNSFGEKKSFLDWSEAIQEVMQTRSKNIKCWMC